MLTIGEFSRACFVSKKTLRYYDELGLLRPEHTAENGYRFYTAGQMRTMLLISRLKEYGFSLPEIAAVLAHEEDGCLAKKLREKRAELEQQAETTRRLLLRLEQDVDKLEKRMDIMEQNLKIQTVELEPEAIFSIRKKLDVADIPSMFGQLFAAVAKQGVRPAGPPMTFYHDEEFKPVDYDMEFAVPVTGGAKATRVRPGGTHCVTVLTGPYQEDTFRAAYAGLVQWTQENGYHLTDAPFDRYVRGGDGAPPEDNVTEIYFPIAK